MHSILNDLLIFSLAAVIFVPIFRHFGIGAILAYLFAGIIIGPDILSLIEDPKVILHFSELGIVFLLFFIGLELAPAKLWKLRHAIFGLGLLQLVLTGVIFSGIGIALGLSLSTAYIAGFSLGLSSTAFGVQILEENKQLQTTHGQGSFAILMFQDLAVVPLLASLAFFSGEGTPTPTVAAILKVVGIILGLIFIGQYVIRHVLRLVASTKTQEVFTAASFLIVLGTAILLESAGLSMGMGAFLAGVLLANSEYRHELEINLEPFKGLLLGLFFIAVGMSLDLQVLSNRPLTIGALTLSFMALKGLIIWMLGRIFKYPNESARNMAFTLPQGGEFAFVLLSAALGAGILQSELNSILAVSVTVSMALTPLLFGWNQKFLRSYKEVSEKPDEPVTSEGAEVIIAGFGRFGQIVSRMLSAEKVKFTILEHSASQVEVARKYGSRIFYGDASRADILESAGAKDAKIFVLAIDDVDKSIETAKMVRNKFPHLNIIARVRNRQHAISLMELGVDNIHRETYLTSLEVAKEVLLAKGEQRDRINKQLATFRKHDEAMLRKQFDFRNDEKKFISYTLQGNAELDSILRADRDQ